jgi:diguanylate cyclase (GGDEF)-like protein
MAQVTGLLWLVLGGVAGVLLGRSLGKRNPRPTDPGPRGVEPMLAPDPALRWLAMARHALGAWVTTSLTNGDRAVRWQRAMPGAALPPEVTDVVEQRLAVLCQQSGSGTERLETGTLLYASSSGLGAGLLLPAESRATLLLDAQQDLSALLDGLARRPMMDRAIAEGDTPVESLGSIGLRLAYQMERILSAEVIVAVDTSSGVRVIGTSSRADRRLLDNLAQPGSPMYQVARGEIGSLTSIADPLGGIVHDRRSHFTPAIVYPIKAGETTVGAVAIWTDDDGAPIGPVIAEVQEAIRNAGPRMVRARDSEEKGNAAVTDPLTGLRNRRGLDEEMHRVGVAQGTLIYADCDKFKLLNDTLGHPAGDAALVHFARMIHDTVRGADVAARIGGEEFAVWLPGASLAYGTRVAERIRIKLATTGWDWQGRSWPLSASFGVAAVPDTTRSLANLPAQADAALLEAKRQGRDRVEAAKPIG